MESSIPILTAVLFLFSVCEGSHFRGALITWKPTRNHTELLISFRISWRRSYSSSLYCDDRTIASQQLIGLSGSLTCMQNCQNAIGDMNFYCTDYSVDEDWTSGRRNYTYTFPNNHEFFQFGFTGGDWIGLNYGGGGWELRVTVNLTQRNDTGEVNSSPQMDMAPIIRMAHGCRHTIKIPVNDPDGDTVRCRWASSSKGECGGACNSFRDAIMDEEACEIHYTANDSTGWYAITVQIEDFRFSISGDNPLSSIPLQFLVYVFKSEQGCYINPQFVKPTRTQGSCVGIPPGGTFFEPIIARSGATGVNITEIQTVSPVGMTKSPLAYIPESDNLWYVNISWRPSESQHGDISIFCFAAVDSLRLTTDQICIDLVGGADPPSIIPGTESPVGVVLPNHTTFTVTFNQEFVRPNTSRYIYIVKEGGNVFNQIDASSPKVIHNTGDQNRTISIVSSGRFYILMDPGIIEGTTFCGLESPPIYDNQFWTIIIHTTAPTVSIGVKPAVVSNVSNPRFWLNCNEYCLMECRVYEKGSNETEFVYCSGIFFSWSNTFYPGTLSSGITYHFEVRAMDEVQNVGSIIQYEWQVDFDPPNLNCSALLTNVLCGQDTSSSSLGTPTITDNVAFVENIYLTNEDYFSNQCGFQRRWMAVDTAGNIAQCKQNILMTSPSPPRINSYPGTAVVACGELDDMTKIFKKAFDIVSPCNMPLETDFTDDTSDGAKLCGSTFIRTWRVFDNCNNEVTRQQEIRILEVQDPVTPTNGEIGIDLLYTLRWPPYEGSDGSVTYNIYIWKASDVRHYTPVGHTSYTQFTPSQPFSAGTRYLWQLEFILDSFNYTILGPKWGFETRFFADLEVESVEIPPVAYSGQSFDVRWTVQNIGNLTTDARFWYDRIYISFSPEFSTARGIGYQIQHTILLPGDGYSSQITVQLRPDDIGLLYVFVFTDWYHYLSEQNTLNNVLRSSDTIDVQLTPPADLRIINIAIPASSFSDAEIYVRWTVKNVGTGITVSDRSYWYDRIIWSKDQFYDGSDQTLVLVQIPRTLSPNSEYQMTHILQIPEYISGEFYILIQTDVYNFVFEYMAEDNNLNATKDPINVILQPTPDLKIYKIDAPAEVVTGDLLTIAWLVLNDGAGSTRSYWRDRVTMTHLSANLVFSLGTVYQFNEIAPGDNYTGSIQHLLTSSVLTGPYNITVEVDYYNEQVEYQAKGNNIMSLEITANQTLPNLSIEMLSVYIYSGEFSPSAEIYAKIINNGRGKTLPRQIWVDSISMISILTMIEYNIGSITTSSHAGIRTRELYEINTTIPIQQDLHGNFKFRLTVDKYKDTSDADRSDNEYDTNTISIPIVAPNLMAISSVEGSLEVEAGQSLNISYQVTNTDTRIPNRRMWRDRVILSFNHTAQAIQIQSDITYFGPLDKNSTYLGSATLDIPNTVAGTFYVHISVNHYRDIYEGDRYKDNRLIYGVVVKSFPSPDLVVTDMNAYIVQSSGLSRLLSLSWYVVNQGNSLKSTSSWTDTIIVSSVKLSKENMAGSINLADFQVSGLLGAYEEYSMTRTVLIPDSFVGTYYVYIKTNSRKDLPEVNAYDNNVGSKYRIVRFDAPPKANLTCIITSVIPEDSTFNAGGTTHISFKVTNTGGARTSKQSWIDAVYLYIGQDPSLEELMTSRTTRLQLAHIGFLNPNESYEQTVDVIIPFEYTGSVTLFITVDDTTLSNKTHIFVSLPKLPNLIPVVASSLENQVGGQPFEFSYKVKNVGEGTAVATWYDSFYLSEDFELDPFDQKLSAIRRKGLIPVNETLDFNATIFLPFDLKSKTYFLILVVDKSNSVYENNKKDNQILISLFIRQSVSTDIVVHTVSTNSSVVFGDSLTVEWTLINNGSREASGYKCDSVFFSRDNILNLDDFQIGESVCSSISLRPYSSTSDEKIYEIRESTPLIPVNTYFAIVRSRSNILDINQSNNIGVSSQTSEIQIEELIIGVRTSFSMKTNKQHAYRVVNIPSDETLIIDLETTHIDGFFNLYVKYGKPATMYDFDIRSDDPTEVKHTVIMPDTKAGDLYILVEYKGFANYFNISTRATILAKFATFEILETYPKSAAPLSNITLTIEGTLIPYDVEAFLYNDARNITALRVFFFSSVSVYATFDIKDLDVEEYLSLQLYSKRAGLNATKENALVTKSGTIGTLSIRLSQPRAFRPGEVGFMTVNILNIGNTDINTPQILVSVEGDGQLKFVTDLKETVYKSSHVIFATPSFGPGGIYAPGSYCILHFEAKQKDISANTVLRVLVSTVTARDNTSHELENLKWVFKPSNYENSTWNKIWSNFMQLVGYSTISLSNKLSEVSTQFSLAGRRVHPFEDYIYLLLEMSDAPKGDSVIVWANDISQIQRKSLWVKLDLERYVSPKLGLRSMFGPLGKTWISPYWCTFIKAINNETATFILENAAYEYSSTDGEVYKNSYKENILRTKSGYIYTDSAFNRILTFNFSTLKLLSIQSLSDDTRLIMQYDTHGRLVTVTHSDGGYFDVEYDLRNRISAIQAKNDSLVGEKTMLYTYFENSDLLATVTVDKETTRYDYDEEGNLVKVVYPDGSRFYIEYSSEGYMISKTYFYSSESTTQDSTIYTYDGAARITVTTHPEDVHATYTFDENADVIAVQRDGYPAIKVIKTKTHKTVVQGGKALESEEFDQLRRHVQIKDANGDSMEILYGPSGHMKAFYDGNGNEYKFETNENLTLDRVIYPDGTQKVYTYKNSGHEVVTQSGTKKVYEFNKLQQITLKDIGDGYPYVFEYDDHGILVKATKELSITLEYNESLVKRIQHEKSRSVEYSYNQMNFKNGIQASFMIGDVSDTYSVEYTYDVRGSLKEVVDRSTGQTLLSVEYDTRGRLHKKTLGNGAITEYRYEEKTGLLESLYNFHTNGSLASKFEYDYDIFQHRINLKTLEGTYTFRYDASGQLIFMESPDGKTTEYSYDNRKNRVKVNKNGTEAAYSVNSMNQYETFGSNSCEYDKNGNMIKKTGTNNRWIRFNEDNQLLSIATSDTTCVMTYDAFGTIDIMNCTDSNGNSIKRHYLSDQFGVYGPDILMQYQSSGSNWTMTKFYHGGDQHGLIGIRIDNNYFYYQFDPIGSVVAILGSSGEVLNTYHYDVFGILVHTKEILDNPFKYVGQWGVMHVPGLEELYYMRARFYDAELGRFLSPDPIGISARSRNFYAYVYNNPIHFNDPKGTVLQAIFVKVVKDAIIGGTKEAGKYAIKSYLDGSFTWGGAAQAFMDGAYDGAVSNIKAAKFLAKIGLDIAKGVEQSVSTAVKNMIDDKPYSWSDFGKDVRDNIWDNVKSTLKDYIPKEIKDLMDLVKNAEKLGEKLKEWKDWFDRTKKRRNELNEEANVNWVASRDPNDIIPPAGYGAARFIPISTVLQYKIRFENDQNATAPAQKVFVEHKFDEDLDVRKFRLGSYGFGNFTRQLNFDRSFEQRLLNLTADLGVLVRVVAGVDLVNRKASWEFQAIDPETGLQPVDPFVGFLPPNNGNGSGEGFVTFSIVVNADAANLARIDANATIYFDKNEPIETPNVFNTIDDAAPEVIWNIINETLSSGILSLSFTGTDVGSGIKEINIYAKEDGGFTPVKTGINETVTSFHLEQGKEYTLLTIPIDFVGNQKKIDVTVENDAFIVYIPFPEDTCMCSGNGACSESGNICICNKGYFGRFCNESIKAQEPPVLEVTVTDGREDEDIELYYSASNISGPVDRLYMEVRGFPNDTLFSNGSLSNGTLQIKKKEFGFNTMSPPRDFSGLISLQIRAMSEVGDEILAQERTYTIYVEPQSDGIALGLDGCLLKNKTTNVAEIKVIYTFGDTDGSEIIGSAEVTIVPKSLRLSSGKEQEPGTFQLAKDDLDTIIYILPDGDPSNVTFVEIKLDVTVIEELKTTIFAIATRTLTINSVCGSATTIASLLPTTATRAPLTVTQSSQTIHASTTVSPMPTPVTQLPTEKTTPATTIASLLPTTATLAPLTVTQSSQTIHASTTVSPMPTPVTQLPTEKTTPGNPITTLYAITFDYGVPENDDLADSATYERYKQEVLNALLQLFTRIIGSLLRRIDIVSVRKGSLVVDCIVMTDNTIEAEQRLSMSTSSLITSSLELFQNQVKTKQLTISNKNVTFYSDGSYDVCSIHVTLYPCQEKNDCRIENGMPFCRQKVTSLYTESIIIAGIVGALCLLLIIVLMLVIVLCRNKRNKKLKQSIARQRQRSVEQSSYDNINITTVPQLDVMYGYHLPRQYRDRMVFWTAVMETDVKH